MILDAGSASAEDIVNRAMICRKTIKENNASIIGFVLNQVPQAPQSHSYLSSCLPHLSNVQHFVAPAVKCLEDPYKECVRASAAGVQVDRANRVDALTKEVEQLLQSRELTFFGALPFSSVLASTRMDEVQASLKAQIQGGHSRTDVTVDNVRLCAVLPEAGQHPFLHMSEEPQWQN